MALDAEERRGKLRKAAVRSKYPLTRRCLNGETRLSKPQSPYTESIVHEKGTRGTETSKYPEEKKETSISSVAASESEGAQTIRLRLGGVVGQRHVR